MSISHLLGVPFIRNIQAANSPCWPIDPVGKQALMQAEPQFERADSSFSTTSGESAQ